jgi:hypothetical protein
MENSIGRLCLLLAAGIVVALLPLSAAVARPRYCEAHLDQKDLRPFEKHCLANGGDHPHCEGVFAPNYRPHISFTCCCE